MSSNKTPQVTNVRQPPVEDTGREDREPVESKKRRLRVRGEDANADEPREDRVYGIASRARWGNEDSLAEMHRDSLKVEGQEVLEPEGGEGEGDKPKKEDKAARKPAGKTNK